MLDRDFTGFLEHSLEVSLTQLLSGDDLHADMGSEMTIEQAVVYNFDYVS